MFRLSSNVKFLTECFPANHQQLQIVRWKRKPIWMGTAKSKLFRVPTRPVIPVEEQEELKRLYNNYRTYMKSIRQFLINKHSVSLLAKSDTEQLQRAFVDDFIRCNEINDEWNAKIKEEREERVAKELEADIEYAKNRLNTLILKNNQELLEAEAVVSKEKELSHNFITQDNIDQAIEGALANPVNYNFAIDLNGNMITDGKT